MKILLRITLFIFCMAVVVLAFFINLHSQLSAFESTAKSKEASVNEYIEISGSFMDLMTVYGNSYLKKGGSFNHALSSYIQYDSNLNSYHMDAIAGSQFEKNTGNLTGTGAIPNYGLAKSELNLALDYSKYFSDFYKRVPEVTWIYYTSQNNFIYMYPWVASGKFSYNINLKEKEFYTYAQPQNNPARDMVWTPVYMDAAGKGLMVTLSSPVYQNDTFAGVLSLDLTTQKLGEMISSKYHSYLVDTQDSIIATSSNIHFSPKPMSFSTLSGLSQSNMDLLKKAADSAVQYVDGFYVYTHKMSNAPWRLYFVVSAWAILGLSLLFTSPILVMTLLLFLSLREADKRRKAEIKLSESLLEIQSYHELLVKSAKHDFLTNTTNRRGLAESFESLPASDGAQTPVSFIMGDIDEFKKFNDTYGHTAGDAVLVEIANIMKSSTGPRDVVCRWGGEEFVIMVLDKTYEEALSLAETIRRKIEQNVIPWADSLELRATMTFGVTEYRQNDTLQKAISKADNALYAGKQKGRNCVAGWFETQDG